MGRKRNVGLQKRGGVWVVDKVIGGRRICQSTGTSKLEEAERFLARLMEQTRQAQVYGVRPERLFKEAAVKYLEENDQKRSLADDAMHLKELMPWIGSNPLDRIHQGSLGPWIKKRKAQQVANGTINHGLKVVRRILRLATTWVDEHGLTWLAAAPKITLLKDNDKRKPYPLSVEEQERLFAELPDHLRQMATFAVNTGCRDGEICGLRWEWELRLPKLTELGTTVFIIPGGHVKNGDDRMVVLNKVAQEIIESRRGCDPEYVFTFRGRPIARMLNSAWLNARRRAGLEQVRVHDLKNTFGRRLRAAEVSFEDRQDLLGHRSGRITTHYSAAEFSRLREAANKVCDALAGEGELLVMRGAVRTESRKSHAVGSLQPVEGC